MRHLSTERTGETPSPLPLDYYQGYASALLTLIERDVYYRLEVGIVEAENTVNLCLLAEACELTPEALLETLAPLIPPGETLGEYVARLLEGEA